jgi:hypothetical protein
LKNPERREELKEVGDSIVWASTKGNQFIAVRGTKHHGFNLLPPSRRLGSSPINKLNFTRVGKRLYEDVVTFAVS